MDKLDSGCPAEKISASEPGSDKGDVHKIINYYSYIMTCRGIEKNLASVAHFKEAANGEISQKENQ